MDYGSPTSGTDAEIMARRASSFGGEAAAYAAERPGYPDAAIRWALDPVAGRTPLRVLDLAAGTGKLTQGILAHTKDVVAVEPDVAMLAELRRSLPEVRALAGTAERIPLDDGSVDAVLVGQAMHWFDVERAFPEVARVLAPGGVLAGLWNMDDDRVPWVRGLRQVARNRPSFSSWNPADGPDFGAAFGPMDDASFPHAQRRTPELMAATIATHSYLLIMPEEERRKVLADVVGYLRATPETASGEFDLPIVTAVIRAVRR